MPPFRSHPNNLTLPIPFSATPPTLCHTLGTFQYIQSVCLTHTVLEHITRAQPRLTQLNLNICSPLFAIITPSVHSTLLSAQRALDRLDDIKLCKLSNLCTHYLNGGGILPFRHPPPLISNKPSLASYLNLSIPPHTPTKLPPKFKPSHTPMPPPTQFPS